MQLSYILPQHLPILFYSTFGLINPRSVIFLPSATAQSCIYTAQHTGAGRLQPHTGHCEQGLDKKAQHKEHTHFPKNLLTVHWGAIS